MAMVHALLLALVLSPFALADEVRDLTQDTEDPTAPLPTITLKDDYTSGFWHRSGDRHTYALTIANPFVAWKRPIY